MTALYVFGATICGAFVGWFFAAFRSKSTQGRVEAELRRQISEKDVESGAARVRESQLISEKSAAVATREASDGQLADARRKLEQYEGEINGFRDELQKKSNALAKAESDREAAKEFLREAKAANEKAISDLRETFKALSADALKENAPAFLRLAGETFASLQATAKGDLEKRQEAIAGLLKPLEEQLRTYQGRLQQGETAQSSLLGEVKMKLETLTQQSESLANETEKFRMVLKSNQARGRWGEETLRRVVEAAGMSAHCDFIEQAQEEDKKPDMVVKLPGDRLIIVDAKVPDFDSLAAVDSADLEKRTQALKAHADKLRKTIKDLADRDYPAQFQNSLDHVVLFLPAESLFSAALEGDHDLIIWAAGKKITLATPATLIALLRAVGISWQQFDQTQNAKAISEAAQDLFQRFVKFTEHFEGIGAGLNKATEAFNGAVGSYETRLRPAGERLLRLGTADGGKALTDIQRAETSLRSLIPQEKQGA